MSILYRKNKSNRYDSNLLTFSNKPVFFLKLSMTRLNSIKKINLKGSKNTDPKFKLPFILAHYAHF